MAQRSLMQTVLSLISSLMILLMVTRFFGVIFTTILIVVVTLMAVTIYLLRFEPQRLSSWYPKPGVRQWIDLVCRLSKQQPPQERGGSSGNGKIALRTAEDFDWAAARVKDDVFGYDHVVDRLLDHLQQAAILREHRESQQQLPPLGVYAVLGPPGIGKRHMIQSLAGRFFSRSQVTTFDMREFADAAAVSHFLGTSGEGGLLKAAKFYPYHTFILEHFEAAHPKLLDALQQIMRDGTCIDPRHGGVVSLQNSLIFLTSESIVDAAAKELTQDQVLQLFCDTHNLNESLLRTCNVVAVLEAPNEETQARVITRLMLDHCRLYPLELAYVEPEIIADCVRGFDPSLGFQETRIQVTRLLNQPIHLAVKHGLENLVLTRDLLQVQTATEPQMPNVA